MMLFSIPAAVWLSLSASQSLYPEKEKHTAKTQNINKKIIKGDFKKYIWLIKNFKMLAPSPHKTLVWGVGIRI